MGQATRWKRSDISVFFSGTGNCTNYFIRVEREKLFSPIVVLCGFVLLLYKIVVFIVDVVLIVFLLTLVVIKSSCVDHS